VTHQFRRDDPSCVGVRGEMQLAPIPTPSRPLLLAKPFTETTQPLTGAVHQKVHRPLPP
jgi:hypothetical protein